MCGIFAYINHLVPKKRREIIEILLQGLSRLEYRGYDSSGFAIDGDFNEQGMVSTCLIKSRGKVQCLRDKAFIGSLDQEEEFQCHVGMAHTRWATHGEPSDLNSHPQPSSPDIQFAVIHNGIITNYRELQAFLETKGHYCISQTGTEVIAKLIQYFYDADENKQKNFRELVEQVVVELEGAFALVFKSVIFPNEVVAARRGSPLLVGIKGPNTLHIEEIPVVVKMEHPDPSSWTDVKAPPIGTSSTALPRSISNSGRMSSMTNLQLADAETPTSIEFFLASDASAVIEHTNRVIYLEDNDVAHMALGEITIHRLKKYAEKTATTRAIKTLEIELEQIMKGSFNTFMQKEIFEQPDSVVNTMRGRVKFDTGEVILGGLRSEIASMRRCRRLLFIACGTSFHSALAIRTFIEEMTEIPVAVELASDFMDRMCPIFRDDVCFFLSQSGETADTLNTLRYCKKHGALIVGITNTVGSTISRESHCGVHVNAGPEIGVASTKAYTSQMVVLIMYALMMASDRLSMTSRCKEVIEGLRLLPSQIKEVLQTDKLMEDLAATLYMERSLLVMGRGYQHATCLEGALKIKELTYMHSEGILSGELKHGPLAMIDENMPVIMIVMNDSTLTKSQNALEQVAARHGRPIVICTRDTEKRVARHAYHTIVIPETIDSLQGILAVIPLQLLSYHIAVKKNLDVDCPRNLAKSVTVE